jgi:hypothetical protein
MKGPMSETWPMPTRSGFGSEFAPKAAAEATAKPLPSPMLLRAREAVLEDYGEAIGRCRSHEEFLEVLDQARWDLRMLEEYRDTVEGTEDDTGND